MLAVLSDGKSKGRILLLALSEKVQPSCYFSWTSCSRSRKEYILGVLSH
jgi:hypothetical protein